MGTLPCRIESTGVWEFRNWQNVDNECQWDGAFCMGSQSNFFFKNGWLAEILFGLLESECSQYTWLLLYSPTWMTNLNHEEIQKSSRLWLLKAGYLLSEISRGGLDKPSFASDLRLLSFVRMFLRHWERHIAGTNISGITQTIVNSLTLKKCDLLTDKVA